ncbi:hypothetical protein, partial [Aeromonas caviae]|uniref:hypothetical protein n=1 Tax=Aeromonas caviae TaxID=648 RepID=UPI001CC6B872
MDLYRGVNAAADRRSIDGVIWAKHKKARVNDPNASQLSLTGIVFTRFSRRILLWFGFDAPWVTSFSAG